MVKILNLRILRFYSVFGPFSDPLSDLGSGRHSWAEGVRCVPGSVPAISVQVDTCCAYLSIALRSMLQGHGDLEQKMSLWRISNEQKMSQSKVERVFLLCR